MLIFSTIFFQYEIRECVERKYLAGYCAYLDSGEIIAAFTLMNDALMISDKEEFEEDLQWDAEQDQIEFMLRQTSYPSINIGHLGVSVDYKRKHIGSDIIDLVAETYRSYRQAGCQFITVDSLNNPATNAFYNRKGFINQTDKDRYSETRRMYMIL